ncbi:MAG: hypothetical protein HUJ58_09455 [Erysipelotrichaceae bacterium]|nr:hypothetical protein [Erysipelotrichaceae bacterium]
MAKKNSKLVWAAIGAAAALTAVAVGCAYVYQKKNDKKPLRLIPLTKKEKVAEQK